ncbi:MAG TPA: hypothetical protein EYQ64_14575 [Gemmatimonadetes bacterium]|nr:hypothetical protein [Gemmatimonadota bacterium]
MKSEILSALLAAMLLLGASSTVDAQQRPERFQRREQQTEAEMAVFHSPQAANLPTAETLKKGEWLFEISHRFFPPVSDGADALWGFDGPVTNRLGLAYAASDRVMLGVLRSNRSDNVELNVRARLFEGGSEAVPVMIGLMGGLAWNTQAPTGAGADENESQQYAQLMFNALLGDRLALGLVPSLLRNPTIVDASSETVFALGMHAQLYVSEMVSFLSEWIISEDRGTDQRHDSGSFGIEFETGGHFFKVMLTNQQLMNPTQFLGGTDAEFTPDEWRIGFNITRLLAF